MRYIHGLERVPLIEIGGSGETRINISDESGMIGVMEGDEVNYLLKDHLGSTRTVVDGAGEKRGQFNYSDFGETTVTGDLENIRYRYTGQEWDEELEEYNYLAREYDPVTGRFNGPDPAREGFSPYVYAGNNPINFVDPSGKAKEKFSILMHGDGIFTDTIHFEKHQSMLRMLGDKRSSVLDFRIKDIDRFKKPFSEFSINGLNKEKFNGHLLIRAHGGNGKIGSYSERVSEVELGRRIGNFFQDQGLSLKKISFMSCNTDLTRVEEGFMRSNYEKTAEIFLQGFSQHTKEACVGVDGGTDRIYYHDYGNRPKIIDEGETYLSEPNTMENRNYLSTKESRKFIRKGEVPERVRRDLAYSHRLVEFKYR